MNCQEWIQKQMDLDTLPGRNDVLADLAEDSLEVMNLAHLFQDETECTADEAAGMLTVGDAMKIWDDRKGSSDELFDRWDGAGI